MSKSTTVQEYLRKSYSGKLLAKQYDLRQNSIWKVLGEDSNADFGGSHYQPVLGYYEGKLEDVIAYALSLPGFFTWGAGGDITHIDIVPISAESVAHRQELNDRVQELKRQQDEIAAELKKLGS